MIIGLIGNQRVGKDTVADYLVKNYQFKKYSFADPIKSISKIIFGWDNEILNGINKDDKDEETGIVPRDFFKWFGTDVMQFEFDNNFLNNNIPRRSIWAYALKNKIDEDLKKQINKNIVITDFRFIHEYQLLLNNYSNINFILVNNEDIKIPESIIFDNYWQYEIKSILEQIIQSNKSFNIIINNNTIEELYYNIHNILFNKIDFTINYNNFDYSNIYLN
jgi:dephospho-CoA kinase